MRRYIGLSVLALTACGDDYSRDARNCGVTEARLKEALESVSPAYASQLGQCFLLVDETGDVLIVTPKIQRVVEELARARRIDAANRRRSNN